MGFLSIQSIIPPGVTLPYSGTSIPSGWLRCDGSAISRTTYAALFASLGTTYGTGDGSTTFNLPDMRGRVIAGRDVQVSGSYANRITSGGAGINSQNLGASGGGETYLLQSTESGQKNLGPVSSGNSNSSLLHNHSAISTSGSGGGSGVANWTVSGANAANNVTFGTTGTVDLTAHTHSITINGSSATAAHQNTQPTIITNYIIKI